MCVQETREYFSCHLFTCFLTFFFFVRKQNTQPTALGPEEANICSSNHSDGKGMLVTYARGTDDSGSRGIDIKSLIFEFPNE